MLRHVNGSETDVRMRKADRRRCDSPTQQLKPCISQATDLSEINQGFERMQLSSAERLGQSDVRSPVP
jgi:hypothetical protein